MCAIIPNNQDGCAITSYRCAITLELQKIIYLWMSYRACVFVIRSKFSQDLIKNRVKVLQDQSLDMIKAKLIYCACVCYLIKIKPRSKISQDLIKNRAMIKVLL